MDIATLRMAVDSTQVARSQRDLDGLTAKAGQTEAAVTRMSSRSSASFSMMSSFINQVAASFTVMQSIRMADEYAKMNAQLKLVTGSVEGFARAQASVVSIAKEAQTSVGALSSLYARLTAGSEDLGFSQKRVSDITRAVALSLKVSNATTAESQSAILQLSQAIGAGALRGEEFNSVNEAAPRLMQALADAIGVPKGALRGMAEQGKLTTEVIGYALPKALGDLEKEAAGMGTISGAFQVLKDQVMLFVGAAAQSSGAVSALTGVMTLASQNLNLLAAAATGFIATKIAAYMISLVSETKALIATTIATIAANKAATAAALEKANADAIASASSLALSNARVAELRASVLAASGTTAVAIAVNGLVPAQARATAASIAHTEALAAQAVASRAAAAASSVSSAALGFLGGPIGAITTLLGLGITAWMAWGSQSSSSASQAARSTEKSTDEIVGDMDRQIEKLKERNRLADIGLGNLVKVESEYAEKLGSLQKQIDNLQKNGTLNGNGAVLPEVARVELIKVLGGQMGKIIERQKELTAEQEKSTGITQVKKLNDEMAKYASQSEKVTAEIARLKKEFGEAFTPAMEEKIRATIKPAKELREEMKRMAEIDKDAGKQVDDVWKKTDALNDQVKKLNMTKVALEELTLAELENQMVSLQATDRVIPGYITALSAQIKAQRDLVQATKDAEAKDASNKSADAALSDFAKLTDKISGEKMRGMFDGATDGAMKFMSALTLVSEIQEKTAAAHAANLQKNGEGTKEFAALQEKIAKQSADATIDSYATMAGALKGYAKKGTATYKALEAAEKVLHAFRLASAIKEIASTFAVGQATAVAGVANQSKGDPYTAFARMAAMAAMMATLGFSVAGGSNSLPESNQGTGTVFGDSSKQSESLTNGISILNETQDTALIYTRKMAESLRDIQNSIDGLSNIYLRGGGTAGAEAGIFTGKFDTALSSALNTINSLFSSIGIPNFGGLTTSLFGGKTSITGSGIGGNAQRFGDVQNNGFQGYNYADVETTKKFAGMSYSTSNSTQTSAMDDAFEQQISSVFMGIGDSLTTATDLLKQDAVVTKDRLQNFIIDIGRVNLKGLTGEQVTERFNAIFSQQADKMAKAVVPGLERLVKAGEGYYETLVRVAQQYELVTVYADRLGHSFRIAGTDGAIFADKLVKLFGGATEFASAMGDYYEQFYSDEERSAMARKEIEKALDSLGKDMPASIEAYRAMVTSASVDTSDAGMKLYSSLIKLGPAFADAMKESTKAADAWKGLSDNMMAEAKRLRDLNVSQSASNGLAYLQSQFAINTAAARSGDQTAAGMLPKLSQSIADAAMLNATSSAEVAVLRGQMAASLEETSRIVTGQPVNINAPIQTASAAEDTKAMRQQIEFLNERIQTLTDNTQAENQAMVTMTNKIVRILQDVSQEGQSLSVTVVA